MPPHPDQPPLDPHQQRLVRQNLGLVAVHVRRYISPGQPSRRDREWEDLYQEGCFGLMRAAQTYGPDSELTFPAFALPRIRSAVDRAFRGAFTTVRCPLYPRNPGPGAQPVQPTTVVSLDFDPPARESSPRHHPDHTSPHQTLGQRLRDRFEDHVLTAARHINTHNLAPTARRRVLDQLVQHRLLVPDPDHRLSVRRIAQHLGLPHSRILNCEKQLKSLIHRRLTDDPETRCLQDLARNHPDGLAAPLDPPVQRQLLETKRQTFLDRLTAASPDHQAKTLLHLIHQTKTPIPKICRHLIQTLNPTQQDQALTDMCTELPAT